MFSLMLNLITVQQTETHVLFSGFRTHFFFKEIQRATGTSRFQKGMVTAFGSMSFRVSLFFAYDFYQVLSSTLENHSPYFNKDITKRVMEEFEKTPLIQRTKQNFPSRLNQTKLSNFIYQPLDYQRDFFQIYEQNTRRYDLNGYILAAAPGSGKTIASLMLAHQRSDINTIVVISPNNALYNVWENTLNEKMVNPLTYYVYGKGDPQPGKQVYIFNHENLKFAHQIVTGLLHGKKIFFIVDECHAFNELKSDRTAYLVDMVKKSKTEDVLFMSGTPFKAFGREVIPFLMCADPKFTANDHVGFVKIFGANGTTAINILASRIGRMSHRIEKHEVVNNKITNFEVRVKIPDGQRFTMKEIRRKMEVYIRERVNYYNLHGPRLIAEYRKIVDEQYALASGQMKKDFDYYLACVESIRNARDLRQVRDEIAFANNFERKTLIPLLSSAEKKIFRDTASVYKYVALKIEGETLGRILGKERELCNIEVLKHIDNGRIWCDELELQGEEFTLFDIFDMSQSKIVMFTDYVGVLQAAERLLKERKFKVGVVYGETNKDLTEILHRFEKDPKFNPIVATLKSLSTAVPLVMADTVVFLNVPYRDYIYKQAVARVDRLGQKHPINIIHYYLDTGDEPNISTRSKEIMELSRDMVAKLMGVYVDNVEEEVENEFVSSFKEGFLNPLKKLKLF